VLLIKSLLVLFSYHHKNTEKIAQVFAKVLDAQIKTPQQINPDELQDYSLVGFGSGIYAAKHHKSLLDLADKLPQVTNKKAFIFSTCGAPMKFMEQDKAEFTKYVAKNHLSLREILQTKGYVIVDEFSCGGFNTNRFLKLFGGINKGRPNAEDLKHAEEFAQNLKQNLQDSKR
jgi:flavodoxin